MTAAVQHNDEKAKTTARGPGPRPVHSAAVATHHAAAPKVPVTGGVSTDVAKISKVIVAATAVPSSASKTAVVKKVSHLAKAASDLSQHEATAAKHAIKHANAALHVSVAKQSVANSLKVHAKAGGASTKSALAAEVNKLDDATKEHAEHAAALADAHAKAQIARHAVAAHGDALVHTANAMHAEHRTHATAQAAEKLHAAVAPVVAGGHGASAPPHVLHGDLMKGSATASLKEHGVVPHVALRGDLMRGGATAPIGHAASHAHASSPAHASPHAHVVPTFAGKLDKIDEIKSAYKCIGVGQVAGQQVIVRCKPTREGTCPARMTDNCKTVGLA